MMILRTGLPVVGLLLWGLNLQGEVVSGVGPLRKDAVGIGGAAGKPIPRLVVAEFFFNTLRRFALWFDDAQANRPIVECTAEVVVADGLSAQLVGQKFNLRVQAPDRSQLAGQIGKEKFVVGRDRNELWLWRPNQRVVWRARSTPMDSLEKLSLPLVDFWSGRLPDLFSVEVGPAANVGQVQCEVVTGVVQPAAQRWLGWPRLNLTLWLGARDHRVRQFRLETPEPHRAVTVRVISLREWDRAETQRWGAPAALTNRVEWVSLAKIRGAFPAELHELGVLSLVDP